MARTWQLLEILKDCHTGTYNNRGRLAPIFFRADLTTSFLRAIVAATNRFLGPAHLAFAPCLTSDPIRFVTARVFYRGSLRVSWLSSLWGCDLGASRLGGI